MCISCLSLFSYLLMLREKEITQQRTKKNKSVNPKNLHCFEHLKNPTIL